MISRPEIVPKTLIHARSDVDAKKAFLLELEDRGFKARVTREPADITAEMNGERYYFEIKKTSRDDSYFGAATLTEWAAALEHPHRYFFVTAQLSRSGWVFHQYSGEEFMRFSSIPPFKIFFQIPVGEARAEPPTQRASRRVRLTEPRVQEMAVMYARWRVATDAAPDGLATVENSSNDRADETGVQSHGD